MSPHRDEERPYTARLAPGSPGDDFEFLREVQRKGANWRAALGECFVIVVARPPFPRPHFVARCDEHGDVCEPTRVKAEAEAARAAHLEGAA